MSLDPFADEFNSNPVAPVQPPANSELMQKMMKLRVKAIGSLAASAAEESDQEQDPKGGFASGQRKNKGFKPPLIKAFNPENKANFDMTVIEDPKERENDLNNILTVNTIRRKFEERLEGGPGHKNRRAASKLRYTFIDEDKMNFWRQKREWDLQLSQVLKSTFNIAAFRLIQKPVVNAILTGKDVFCCMPTGGGKLGACP